MSTHSKKSTPTEEGIHQPATERAGAGSEARSATDEHARERAAIGDAATRTFRVLPALAAVIVRAESSEVVDDHGVITTEIDINVAAEFVPGARVSRVGLNAVAGALDFLRAVAMAHVGGLSLGGELVFHAPCP